MRPSIQDLAARYVRARDAVTRLHCERDACVCDFEYVSDFGETLRKPLRARTPFPGDDDRVGRSGAGGAAVEAPCWAMARDEEGNGVRVGDLASEGWCESCRKRQEAHTAYRRAVRQRAASLGALISGTRARLDIRAPKKLEPIEAPVDAPTHPASDTPDCPF